MDTSPDVYADLAEASQILGLSQEAIRKRLHRGTLQGCKVDGRWMVRLPIGRLDADRDDPDACQDARQDVAGRLAVRLAGRPDDGTWTASGCPDERQDARDALLERLYRDNLELAGRCGFLQARVQDLEREIRQLSAPSSEIPKMAELAPAPTSNPNPLPPRLTARIRVLSALLGGHGGSSGRSSMGTFQMKQGALATLFHEAIATTAADMNKRLAVLQADSDLSPQCRAQLSQAIRARAQVELAQMWWFPRRLKHFFPEEWNSPSVTAARSSEFCAFSGGAIFPEVSNEGPNEAKSSLKIQTVIPGGASAA